MTNPNSTEIQTTLTDDQIVAIARKTDEFIMSIGDEFNPSGIEFAAIALGRLMVFTKSVDCYPTFQRMLEEITKLKEPEPLMKTQDLN